MQRSEMIEVPLETAAPELSQLADDVVKTMGTAILTRNGREIARIERARKRLEPPPTMSGDELDEAFLALREKVRDQWPEEPEFDIIEAIQSGRR